MAALNWGYRLGYFETDRPWTSIGPFPVSDGQRDGYLSDIQRSALIVACDANKTPEDLEKDPHLRYCTPDLGNLLRGYFYTGTRPGELAKVRVEAPESAREESDRDQREEQNGGGQAQGLLFI